MPRTTLHCVLGAWCSLVSASTLVGCNPSTIEQRSDPIVYGSDDRLEYFDSTSAVAQQRMAAAVVALIPNNALRADGHLSSDVPSWGQRDGLCASERFADQPAAAFCTGVLVDWDLVLTAGHCARAYAPQDFSAVFGYYYGTPGELATRAGDVYDVVEIVAEAMDPPGASPRLDYAWLRLGRPVRPPHWPAPAHRGAPTLHLGDALVAISAGGGAPLKIDSGGRVRDAHEDVSDYFVADTDTSHGSSGGGAFDNQMTLLGVLARGAPDYVEGHTACYESVRQPDPLAAQEEYTLVDRAIDGLCEEDPFVSTLCRPDCGTPCSALPLAPEGGCSIKPERTLRRAPVALMSLLILAGVGLRRRRATARDSESEHEVHRVVRSSRS